MMSLEGVVVRGEGCVLECGGGGDCSESGGM